MQDYPEMIGLPVVDAGRETAGDGAAGAPPEVDGVDRGRLQFLQKIASGIFASLILPGVLNRAFGRTLRQEAPTEPEVELPELPPPTPDEDPIVRMMRDLQRALKKPMEQRRWGMVIDLRKCVGCDACTIACAVENNLPPGVVYRPVLEEEIGEYPNVRRRYIPRPCMQCDRPPCVPVCPVNATWKRPDGIVEIDYDRCIGCRYCITACPYSARVFDKGHFHTDGADFDAVALLTGERASVYEKRVAFEYGEPRKRTRHSSPVGNARKCHFCLHRIEKGLLPQCVVSCIGRATFFGDLNDPESLVSELAAQPNVMRLKEEMGTEPKVFYLL
ncbi:4Fe-4S dicluster domain-containing protein [Rhodothermus marinus]|uniref:4Fe-4S dicluster domain-containing protein n=1 Tax=Rhodothermus marinus TaxID=29549 RepID=UPI0037CA0B56